MAAGLGIDCSGARDHTRETGWLPDKRWWWLALERGGKGDAK